MSASKEWFYEFTVKSLTHSILPVTLETLRLLPDSIVLGTAILSMVSLCKSYAVMLLAMIELMLVQRVLSNIIGSVKSLGAGKNTRTGAGGCKICSRSGAKC